MNKNEAKFIKHHLPCPACGSSDAASLKSDGSKYCHSCNTFTPAHRKLSNDSDEDDDGFIVERVSSKKPIQKESLDSVSKLMSSSLPDRKISKDVLEFFEVKVLFDSDRKVIKHYYPYDGAYKVRVVADKDFYWIGKSDTLFGKAKFGAGGKRVIITEGELDAMSVAQAQVQKYGEGKIYPVVSIPSASGSGENSLIENREWIRSFDEVVLMFDADKPGQEMAKKAVRIIGADKVKLVHMPDGCKDASDVLRKFDGNKLMQVMFDAHEYIPPGILTKEELWERLATYNEMPSIPYPDCLHGVQKKTKGLRKGEITLLVSGTGSGKSSLMREIMWHIVNSVPDEEGVLSKKIGILALEESPEETARKLSGLALNKNPSHEEISLEELKKGYDMVFGEDRVMIVDHQGAVTDDTVMDKLEYLALKGCEYLFIDHITILISEGVDGLEGNAAQDKVMNDLLRLVKRHNVWVGLISHLRKTTGRGRGYEEGLMPNLDSIRGSGSTKQIAMDVIAFARNQQAKSEQTKNTIRIAVLKCRYTGLTGEVEGAIYDHPTGRMKALDYVPEDDDDSEFGEI